ncbi:MAG TPA: NAD-dependent epimerase/dehydratase family protein [Nitrospirota bacterium]|nr:NAD-dependent epimerase/dehydratase family protein [Nitrospirota bacterium]
MERTESQRALVTGGTGFVGSHLVELLLRKGYDVICLVRDPARLHWLTGLKVRVVQGDCVRPESLVSAVRDISVVFHVAGLTKARHARDYYAVNHVGTRNLLEACAKHNPGIKKFLLVSSLAAAGPCPDGKPVMTAEAPHPITDYGKSKLLAEEEALRYRDTFPVVILRPSAVYGPRDRDMFELFRWANRGLTLELWGGERYLNPCYVGDLAEAMLFAAGKETRSGSIYFIAENRSYSWSEFKEALLSTGGVKARTIKIPYAVAYLIGLASEFGGLFTSRPALMNRQKVREAAQKYWICDLSKTENELGFRHEYPLRRGLEITWQWYRDNVWL